MAKSSDLIQKTIVKDLRNMGMTVIDLHGVGRGCPDIIVGYRGFNYLFEIKDKHGRLTDKQIVLHQSWRGQIAVIRSTSDAISVVNNSIKERCCDKERV